MSALSQQAKELHGKMMESPGDTLFSQEQLEQFTNKAGLMGIIQELVGRKLVKLFREGEQLRFKALSVSEANKVVSMSEDEAMIYSHIEASGREGIWTKTIKAKTNLHQHIVVRCLKSLENQRYIKSIKSVKHPTRKIYMLYNLQPSIDVTGGPWFTDSELDSEFIDSLLAFIWRLVASKTYPAAFSAPTPNMNILQSSYPYNHTGYIDINDIMDVIVNSGIANVELGINDLRALCDVLVYDDKLELVMNSIDKYKVTWQSVLDAGYGKQYLQKENMTPEIANLLSTQTFSIFNNRSDNVIDEEEEDLVYFDAWVHS